MLRIAVFTTFLGLILGVSPLAAQTGSPGDPTLNRSNPVTKPAPPAPPAPTVDPQLHRIPAVPRFRPLGTTRAKIRALGSNKPVDQELPLEPEIDPTLHRSADFKSGTTAQLTGTGPIQGGGEPVPEPETWALFLLGLSLLGFTAWKRGLLDQYLVRAPESR